MINGKWITELAPTTHVADAARRVLGVRLEVVHAHLPNALHAWKADPEHVHQLRVGTRRGGAALAIFAFCLPAKTVQKTKKCLRKLRRAAGAARDWDVFGQALAERAQSLAASHRPGLDFLLGYAQAQRVAAQATLEQASGQRPYRLERLIAETVAAIHGPDGPPRVLADIARPWLSEILDNLHIAADDDLEQYERLHQVRILGKRLRYGMEVFASCFDKEFKDMYYPMVEEMQEILGLANDSYVASQRLVFLRGILRASQAALWKRFRPGIEGLLRYHQRRLPQQQKHFLRWWARWEKSGAEAALTGMVQSLG